LGTLHGFAPGSKLGPFATIGAGGIGEVYRARNTKLGRDVALKFLQEAFAYDRDRMDDSSVAQVLASLNHSNIAPIYGLEELDRAILLAVKGSKECEPRSILGVGREDSQNLQGCPRV
jgi:hypothetical protein